MTFLFTGFICGIVLIIACGLKGLAAAFRANLVLLVSGKLAKRVELRVCSLPAASDELAAEVAHVSETWVKKALPDF